MLPNRPSVWLWTASLGLFAACAFDAAKLRAPGNIPDGSDNLVPGAGGAGSTSPDDPPPPVDVAEGSDDDAGSLSETSVEVFPGRDGIVAETRGAGGSGGGGVTGAGGMDATPQTGTGGAMPPPDAYDQDAPFLDTADGPDPAMGGAGGGLGGGPGTGGVGTGGVGTGGVSGTGGASADASILPPSIGTPTVTYSGPYTAPQTITFVGTPIRGAYSVAKVEFLHGAAVLCTASYYPWRCSWASVAGTYAVSARVSDTQNPALTGVSPGTLPLVVSSGETPLIDSSSTLVNLGDVSSGSTPSFRPPAGSLLVALISGNTPDPVDPRHSISSNPTLNWTRPAYKNGAAGLPGGAGVKGYVEVWYAYAPTPATSVVVTSSVGLYSDRRNRTLAVKVITGASGPPMNFVSSSGSGRPSNVLPNVGTNALCLSVASDWWNEGSGTTGWNQTMLDTYRLPVTTTHIWRYRGSPSPNSSPTLNLTAPDNQLYNAIAFEIRP